MIFQNKTPLQLLAFESLGSILSNPFFERDTFSSEGIEVIQLMTLSILVRKILMSHKFYRLENMYQVLGGSDSTTI